MKRLTLVCVGVAALALLADTVMAQRPGGPGRGPGGPGMGQQGMGQQGMGGQNMGGQNMGGQNMGGDGNFQPPPSPLMLVLDTNRDGELSAEEIAAASTTLRRLDRNSDGNLSQEELRPQFGGPRGGQGGQGDQGGQRAFGGPGGQRGFGGPGGGPGGQRGFGGPGGQDETDEQDLAQRIMAMDKNGNGRVEKRELPGRMSRLFERADTDNDGAIDEQEAQTVSDEFQRRGQRTRRPKRPTEE